MFFFCFGVWQCMQMKLKQKKNKNYLRLKINYNIYVTCLLFVVSNLHFLQSSDGVI